MWDMFSSDWSESWRLGKRNSVLEYSSSLSLSWAHIGPEYYHKVSGVVTPHPGQTITVLQQTWLFLASWAEPVSSVRKWPNVHSVPGPETLWDIHIGKDDNHYPMKLRNKIVRVCVIFIVILANLCETVNRWGKYNECRQRLNDTVNIKILSVG